MNPKLLPKLLVTIFFLYSLLLPSVINKVQAEVTFQDIVTLILNNRPLFTLAESRGIVLPPIIKKILLTGILTQRDIDGIGTTQSTASYTRDITIGTSGTDVTTLQQFLITENKGTQARLLAGSGTSGYFGLLTKAALTEYQSSVDLSPSGVLDQNTRNYLNQPAPTATSGSTTTVRSSGGGGGGGGGSAPTPVPVVTPDTIAPSVSITTPTTGSTISSSVSVTATASDNVGVAGVQFKLDGALLGAEDTSSPYTITFDTTTATNASHTLVAVARDAAGNRATSTGVSVTVNNAVSGSTEPTFNSSTDTNRISSLDGTFDSYTSLANAQSQWSIGSDSGSTPLLVTGRGGTGNAVRQTWPVSSGETLQYLGAGYLGGNYTHLITTFWFKTSINADPTSNEPDHSGFKWLLFQRTNSVGNNLAGRITWGVNNLAFLGAYNGEGDGGVQFVANDQTGGPGMVQNISKAIGWSNASKTRTTSINDGNWHRATYEADTIANVMKAWIDGVLIMDNTGGNFPMDDIGFSEVDFGQNIVPHNANAFSVDYDDIQIYTK